MGKGVICCSKPEKIDFQVVERILKAPQTSTGVVCSEQGDGHGKLAIETSEKVVKPISFNSQSPWEEIADGFAAKR